MTSDTQREASATQREARALGDPTRHSLFRYIADASEPVTVSELTQYVQLNHNAVRQHLAVLRDAGLIVEEPEERDRPGRPRLLYRLHPEVAGRWDTPSAYAWLASMLSATIRRGLDPRQVGRLDGHRRAADVAGTDDPADLLEQEMSRRGFRPERADDGERVEFVLGVCPFAEVAADDPDTICMLHLGMAEGMAEGLGGLTIDHLVVKNAHKAGCRLIAHRGPGPGSSAGISHED